MTDASERERLIALMSNRCPDGCRCSFQLTADMLRADAKVADALRDAEQRELAALQELDEASAQLAAQSAELERVRKEAERYRAQGETMRLACNKVYAGIAAYLRGDIDKQALTIATDAFYIALAAPSAAGGEKAW